MARSEGGFSRCIDRCWLVLCHVAGWRNGGGGREVNGCCRCLGRERPNSEYSCRNCFCRWSDGSRIDALSAPSAENFAEHFRTDQASPHGWASATSSVKHQRTWFHAN